MADKHRQALMDGQTNLCRMVNDKIANNASFLKLELDWLSYILSTRLEMHAKETDNYEQIIDIKPPEPKAGHSLYEDFVIHYDLTFAERFVLVLSLVPHVKPEILDVLFIRNEHYDRGYTEFGGVVGANHSGFLPTAETALFILGGKNLLARFSLQPIFDGNHIFAKHNILELERANPLDPMLCGIIRLSKEYFDFFTIGEFRKPNFNNDFPAQLIESQLQWDDLVLDTGTMNQINELKVWIECGDTLMDTWGMKKKLRPGYRCLFYGPPGTGKTMAACLLGKVTHRDVYKIDLSMVVSKYIGETGKNLAKIFEQAEHKNWILFFDEADALFGKRTNVEDAHDRYANQEVSFLLQRIESFNGLVILASNLKGNMDEAFTRRFESMIKFNNPAPEERLKIWKKSISDACSLSQNVSLKEIANKYELSGGAIMNIIRYVSLTALSRSSTTLELEDMEKGIKREYIKEGKTF